MTFALKQMLPHDAWKLNRRGKLYTSREVTNTFYVVSAEDGNSPVVGKERKLTSATTTVFMTPTCMVQRRHHSLGFVT